MNFYTKLMGEFLHDNGCKLIRDKNGVIRLRRWDMQIIEPEHCIPVTDGKNLVMWLEKPANEITSYLIEKADEWGLIRPFDFMMSETVNGMGKCYYVMQDNPEYWVALDHQMDMKSPEYKFFYEYEDLIDICYMLSIHAYLVNIEELVEE